MADNKFNKPEELNDEQLDEVAGGFKKAVHIEDPFEHDQASPLK